MKIILAHERATIIHGKSENLGELLPENSVDSIVTDPPAGINFMGKGWDSHKGGRDKWISWLADLLASAFRALKPGGYGLIWAIPRTSHWTATAAEDAGFEIRDIHHHIFGTGFPKSLTSKSAEIPEWAGTALKPSVEHWILVRKPIEGTVAECYAKYGTGVLNIDGCRIDGRERTDYGLANSTRSQGVAYGAPSASADFDASEGRWPAHLSLDEHAAALLDEQSGTLTSGAHSTEHARSSRGGNGVTHGAMQGVTGPVVASSKGGASRFFYVAKGARKEKDAGLDHLAPRTGGEATGRADDSAGTKNPRAGAGRTGGARNFHPTVKSVALMQWLVRLVTPPGGIVLDPFAGSGTTGVAALGEGMSFIGCEQGGEDDEYLPILVGRIRHALGYTGPGDATI